VVLAQAAACSSTTASPAESSGDDADTGSIGDDAGSDSGPTLHDTGTPDRLVDTGSYDVAEGAPSDGAPKDAAPSPLAGLAEAAFAAFNDAYLVTGNGQTYYAKSLDVRTADQTWTQDLDIQVAEDAYERTGSPATRTLVNDLLQTWLAQTPPPWSWDGWNDDIGWFSLALVRGYQMTGNATFLSQAEYGFNFAFGRGWDTSSNGGGIWEEQPANGGTDKEALSNDSLAQVAAMLYQSTGNATYLQQTEQIYAWVRTHLFDPSSGQVYTGIKPDGTVDKGTALYNQGTFVDLAQLLYTITGQTQYYDDAVAAIGFAQKNLTINGIFNDTATYRNTWAPEFARALGHFVKANNLWTTYYPWMVANAKAAWAARRTDKNVAWNAWTQPTPATTDVLANWDAGMVAMLQFTPANEP
jgi:hypothetical protein